MLEINYTNTIDEIKDGFIGIYTKYTMKRTILFSLAYLVAIILGVDFIIKNPSGFSGYALFVTGAAMLFMQWARPYMVRKKLVRALAGLYEERYTAKFYDDRIEIETEILNDDGAETEIVAISESGVEKVENPAIIAQVSADTPPPKPEKTVINIATEELCSYEDESIFRLYVNRGLVYIFPKRCMDRAQITALGEYFSDKAI